MRTRILLFVCLMFFASSYIGCKKTNDGVYVEPIKLYEKLRGNWKLNEILQIDETAKTLGTPPTEISLFSEFNFESFNIALNVDNANNPTSYKVTGSAPELFPNEGFWDLDSSFPVVGSGSPVINLYADAARTSITGQFTVVSVPGAKAEMELKLTRKSEGAAFVSYQYRLSGVKP